MGSSFNFSYSRVSMHQGFLIQSVWLGIDIKNPPRLEPSFEEKSGCAHIWEINEQKQVRHAQLWSQLCRTVGLLELHELKKSKLLLGFTPHEGKDEKYVGKPFRKNPQIQQGGIKYRLKTNQTLGQRKAFYRHRIAKSNCIKKERHSYNNQEC